MQKRKNKQTKQNKINKKYKKKEKKKLDIYNREQNFTLIKRFFEY